MHEEIARRRAMALALGGPDRIERERRAGRLTVRERIALLLDPGSFHEVGSMAITPMEAADGERLEPLPAAFLCGFGTIDGRHVVVGAEDYTVQGGAATIHLEKFKGSWTGYVEDLAYQRAVPLVLLMNGAGGSVSAQTAKGYAYIVAAMRTTPILELLDRVPVVTAVLGPVAGSGAARIVCSHFSIMSRPNGCMFAGGPPLVERSLGRPVDKFELGGVDVHVAGAGNIDNAGEDEPDIFRQARRFLSYLPPNVDQLPPVSDGQEPAVGLEELEELAAAVGRGDYDVRRLIAGIVDAGSVFEMGAEFGRSMVSALARVEGRPVGVLAHDARVDGGAMDGLAADKQVRLVQLCDTFHLPILVVVDTPGLQADEAAEADGVVRRWTRAVGAIHRATVPVLTLHVGRVAGLAGMATTAADHLAMRFAWPTATIEDEAGLVGEDEAPGSLWRNIESFGIEEVIEPRQTRATVAAWLGLGAVGASPGAKTGQQFRP